MLIPVIIVTFILCFIISHVFLSVFLYEDKEELKNFKSDIFSYVFGLSNVLLALIVTQIADIGESQYIFI